MVRLVSTGGDTSGARGSVFFESGDRSWTSTKIESFLSSDVTPGRKFKAGIVEYTTANPNEKKLLSNEVEFLLLIKIENVTPSPVPLGVGEIEAETATSLGTRGSKVVKFGNQQASVMVWDRNKFKFKIPSGLHRPAVHELFIEENGQVVSTKLSVKLLGPEIRHE
jgi:hypothetical protein